MKRVRRRLVFGLMVLASAAWAAGAGAGAADAPAVPNLAAAPGKDAALRDAVARVDHDAARRLLREGADPGAEDADGQSALALALERRDKEMISLLLTPAIQAAMSKPVQRGLADRPEARAGEEDALGEVNRVRGEEKTVQRRLTAMLVPAARSGYYRVVEALLDRGGDPNVAMDAQTGQTPLHFAAAAGETAVARLLIRRGARLDVKDADGLTPVDAALKGKDPKLAAAMQQTAALVGALRKAAPLADEPLPSSEDEIGCLDELRKRMDKGEPIHLDYSVLVAAEWGHAAAVKFLLDKGASVEARNANGFTALHTASAKGRLAVVEVLLKRGAKAAVECGPKRHTPLHDAAFDGHLAVARALLGAGAAIDARTSEGATPLHGAAQNGHADMVEFLLVKGAKVDPTFGPARLTPLHVAAERGHATIVRKLLLFGADPLAKDAGGRTPAQRAKEPALGELLAQAAAGRKPPASTAGRPTGASELVVLPIKPEDRKVLGIDCGVLAAIVAPDSRPHKAGLRSRDIILECDRQPVDDPTTLARMSFPPAAGKVARLKILRGALDHPPGNEGPDARQVLTVNLPLDPPSPPKP